MLRINRMVTILILVALLASACQPIQPVVPGKESAPLAAVQGAAPHSHQARPDAPPYGVRGTYAVSVRDFTVEGTQENDRTLIVSVWYPAQKSADAQESISYALGFPTNEYASFTTAGNALRDAAPDMSGGPYPLVIYSHGAYTFRQQAVYLMEHLASHGFVVMATDHEDNWGTLFEPTYLMEVSRPRDMSRMIDLAEHLTASSSTFDGLIDTAHVAATGFSMGGEIAMEMGGARLNLAEWQQTFCVEFPDNADCTDYRDHLSETAILAGLDATPDGLWPDWSDPRVDVIVPLAPNANMFGGGGLDNVKMPVLFVVGSGDTAVGPGIAYRRTFESLPSTAKTRVIFENANHLMFMNACPAMPGMAEAGYSWACSDAVWDMDRAHDLINHFVTAFLLAELKGDAEAAKALAPENVTFPGIQYETTAYTVTVAAAATEPITGFAQVNGTRLYYEMAGAGDPVILLHGFGADSRYWQAQFEALAQQYQVTRYDLRGFGKSDLPETEPYTHADDLKALLDYLGIERAHIIGHSFGGENAINFALAYPEATRSLILVDNDVQGAEGLPASTPEEDAAWATIFAALEKGDKRAAAAAVLDLHPLFVVARTMPAARNLQIDMFADYSWWHLTGGADPVQVPEVPAAKRLGEIKTPTLVIIGELDNEYQQMMVEITVKGIPGAQKVVMPGLDHSPFVEDSTGFNQIVLAFLAGK